MNLNEASKDILMQLEAVIKNLKEEDFFKPIPSLNQSTLGQHVRHTLEFFTCLIDSLEGGIINYDKRDHDKVIETDQTVAIGVIENLIHFLSNPLNERELILEANYSLDNSPNSLIKSNFSRELAYNIEHAIHHMAIIKIGIKEIAPYIKLDDNFGVAVSTIKYQAQNKAG